MTWPLAGLNRRYGFQNKLDYYSTPDSLNVRNTDVFENRLRGGSRPGLVQVLPPKAAPTPPTPPTEPIVTEFFALKDTWLYFNQPGTPQDPGANNSSNIIGGQDSTVTARTVMHFDLTTIPAGSTVSASSLRLRCVVRLGATTAIAMKARRILTADVGWVETQASWNDRATATAWSVANLQSPQTGPYSTSDPAELDWAAPLPASNDPQIFMITGFEVLVQDAVTNRSKQLHVMFMQAVETGATQVALFTSTRHAVMDHVPKLNVTYTPP